MSQPPRRVVRSQATSRRHEGRLVVGSQALPKVQGSVLSTTIRPNTRPPSALSLGKRLRTTDTDELEPSRGKHTRRMEPDTSSTPNEISSAGPVYSDPSSSIVSVVSSSLRGGLSGNESAHSTFSSSKSNRFGTPETHHSSGSQSPSESITNPKYVKRSFLSPFNLGLTTVLQEVSAMVEKHSLKTNPFLTNEDFLNVSTLSENVVHCFDI